MSDARLVRKIPAGAGRILHQLISPFHPASLNAMSLYGAPTVCEVPGSPGRRQRGRALVAFRELEKDAHFHDRKLLRTGLCLHGMCVHSRTHTDTHSCARASSLNRKPVSLARLLVLPSGRLASTSSPETKSPSSPEPTAVPTSHVRCPKGQRPGLLAGAPRAQGQGHHCPCVLDHGLPPHSSHASPSQRAALPATGCYLLTKVTAVATASGAKTL